MSQAIESIAIIADFREQASGVPEILEDIGVKVTLKSLKIGDYIINDQIIVERKSKDDFIVSLMQGRLFLQCANLKKTKFHQILLIEGNPYKTKHKIDRQAIKGALLSISLSWQIPIIYSSNTDDSAQTLIMAAKQNLQEKFNFQRTGYRPKTTRKRALYFLQGLPLVGPKLADVLLKHFGSLGKVISASESELLKVEGLGNNKLIEIKEFLKFVH